MAKKITMNTKEGGKSYITVEGRGDTIDLVFVRAGTSAGIRLPPTIARLLRDALTDEINSISGNIDHA